MPETRIEKGTFINSKNALILGIVLLILLIAVFSLLNRDKTGLKEGTVVVTAGGITISSLTIADLKELPVAEKKMTIHTSQGNTENEFTGTPLLAVLNSIDPVLTQKYNKIFAKGIDNYISGMDISEVLRPDNVYIVYANYGKPLKTKTGEEGSMKVIICSDEFGYRFTNWLVSLELQ